MTDIQADCTTPERTLVGHPFNPPYLMPLVVRGFFLAPEGNDEGGVKEAPMFCLVPLCLTAFGCLVMFFYADQLYALLRPIGGG